MPSLARRTFLVAGMLAALGVSAQPATALQATAERILHEVTGAEVRPYSTRDFGREKYPAGRSVRIAEEGSEDLLDKVRRKLPAGLVAWTGAGRDHSVENSTGVELAIAPGRDQFDILRAAATDGANYSIQTEDIVKELQAWDREFGIDIWMAETDTVQMTLKRLPKDVKAFAKHLYKFCPDVVDQGVGSVAELARTIAKDKAVYLWWD